MPLIQHSFEFLEKQKRREERQKTELESLSKKEEKLAKLFIPKEPKKIFTRSDLQLLDQMISEARRNVKYLNKFSSHSWTESSLERFRQIVELHETIKSALASAEETF
jgi:thymidylate synthase